MSNNRNRTLMIVGGLVAVLALCLCAVLALGMGGYFFYQQQGGVVTTQQQPAVEYILDASPRMAQPTDGGTRLEVARGILAEVVRPADTAVTAGLRVFGNGAVATACQDTNLLVPLAVSNQAKIADAATGLEAGSASDAAMAEAMVNAIRDLANTKGPHTLVVITGGTDDCQAQAGEIIKAEAARAGIKLEEFVVGFQLSAADSAAVKSLVAASTDGSGTSTYLDAPDADTLHNILTAIQAHVDQPTTVPIAVVQQAATPGAVLSLPTAAPHTAVPQATAAAAATAAAGRATSVPITGFQGQTACDHPYMPLRTGATWTYSSPQGAETWVVQDVSGDQTSAIATVLITVADSSITYHWHCDTEGIRFYQAGVNSGGVSLDMGINNEKGVAILAADKFVPGATWDYSYTMTFGEQGTTINTSVSQVNTAGDIIPVTNALGTFDTITVTGTLDMSVDLGGSQAMSGTQSLQFGKGVGLLEVQSTMAGNSSSYSLTSYHIP
jgi:hypothetical protein